LFRVELLNFWGVTPMSLEVQSSQIGRNPTCLHPNLHVAFLWWAPRDKSNLSPKFKLKQTMGNLIPNTPCVKVKLLPYEQT